MKVRIKYVSSLMPSAVLPPAYATKNSAGMDCRACVEDGMTVMPNERVLVPLGFSIEIPEGYAGFIYGRSGLGVKHGITLSNCVGVIDSDYRGEVKCALTNYSNEPFIINKGDRICQLVISPVETVELEASLDLSDTTRADGGFGSTGKN